MARNINMDSLNQKIEKAEQEVVRTRKAYDTATAELKNLMVKSTYHCVMAGALFRVTNLG